MTLSSQQYANLADHSYGRNPDTTKVDLKSLVGKSVEIEGVEYKVLAHVDKPSGYQGTIYQKVDSGEIVAAHRGTEFGREPLKDGLLADGGMVFGRVNSQAADAIELTREALSRAESYAAKRHISPPEVTVTGHSLGGTLAQITAHHFDLRGETFNAYGATSLGYRIPEGGNRVLNHVMAADVVSSASPHYGQVRVYAKPGEINQLQASGYSNSRIMDALIPDNPVAASLNTSHMMHNFLNVDGDGKRDVSALGDAGARTRANDNERMIQDYRGDVRALRTGASLGGDAVDIIRQGPLQAPGRAIERAREAMQPDLPAGEPARREGLNPGSTQPSAFNPQRHSHAIIPSVPDHLHDFRHPDHPQHGRYQGVLQEVHRMEERGGIPSGPHSEQMAAALADKLSKEDKNFALDRLEMRGQDVVALARRDNYFEPERELSLNADQALSRPVEQVSADWAKRAMPHLGRPALEQANALESRQLADHDLRLPDQMRHGQRESLREQVADTYAKAGIVRNEAQLELATRAVALDMQRYGLDRADHMHLLPNRDGMIGPDSGIGAIQGHYPLQLRSQTPGETLQQAPDESHRQLAQATQQQTMEQQQRQAAAQQPQSGGLSMG